MNTIDILLTKNKGLLKPKTKKVEITRLSEEFGEPVYFTIRGLTNEEYNYANEESTMVVGSEAVVDQNKFRYMVTIEGIQDPDIKNNPLKEKYSCAKNEEVLDNLLLSAEINIIFNEILNLSGFNGIAVREVVEEVKN